MTKQPGKKCEAEEARPAEVFPIQHRVGAPRRSSGNRRKKLWELSRK